MKNINFQDALNLMTLKNNLGLALLNAHRDDVSGTLPEKYVELEFELLSTKLVLDRVASKIDLLLEQETFETKNDLDSSAKEVFEDFLNRIM